MSVEAMALVLHHSKASGTAKVVLLGIANHEGDGGAWPSLATLARYANVTVRNVQKALRDLEASGELWVGQKVGGTPTTPEHYRPNLYRVMIRCPQGCDRTSRHRETPPVASDTTPPVEFDTTPLSQATPEPSIEPSVEPSMNYMAQRSAPSVSDRDLFALIWMDAGGDPALTGRAYDDIKAWEGATAPGRWAQALHDRGEFTGYLGTKGPGLE